MKGRKLAIGCLAGLGAMLSLVGLTSCKSSYIRCECAITDAFENISILTDTADIDILASNDGTCKVVCNDRKRIRHTVTVQDGTLTVQLEDTRKWYDFIGSATPSIMVWLPEGEYKGLNIEESTGDIEISSGLQFTNMDISLSTGDVSCYASATENIEINLSTGDIYAKEISARSIDLSASTGSVKLENSVSETLNVTTTTGDITMSTATCGEVKLGVSTGKTYLTDMTCASLTSTGDTGKLIMNNVVCSGKFTIERTTGDVTFEDCDAAEILVETSTGNVTGTLRSEKIFIPRTSTGDIDVPETVTGGKCKITTSTGDIEIKIAGN